MLVRRDDRTGFPRIGPADRLLTFWQRVFAPRGNAIGSLGTSVWIAVLTVVFSLAVAIPAGYALGRLKLPWRGAILLAFLFLTLSLGISFFQIYILSL